MSVPVKKGLDFMSNLTGVFFRTFSVHVTCVVKLSLVVDVTAVVAVIDKRDVVLFG